MSCFVGALINENVNKKRCNRCNKLDFGVSVSEIGREIFYCDECIIMMHSIIKERSDMK